MARLLIFATILLSMLLYDKANCQATGGRFNRQKLSLEFWLEQGLGYNLIFFLMEKGLKKMGFRKYKIEISSCFQPKTQAKIVLLNCPQSTFSWSAEGQDLWSKRLRLCPWWRAKASQNVSRPSPIIPMTYSMVLEEPCQMRVRPNSWLKLDMSQNFGSGKGHYFSKMIKFMS